MIIKTKPVPMCDECGGMMVLRKPRDDQTWDAFWGCSSYPECRNTYNIDQHGDPEIDSIDPLEHLINDDGKSVGYYDDPDWDTRHRDGQG